MATYQPNMDWLRHQLHSLEAQTYPNLRLYIRDDASPDVTAEQLRACAEECVKSFPVHISRNGENLGSNETFARLTAEAEGEYFAYCDQDDIWLPGKLAALQSALEREGALLVCSDMTIIDAVGRQTADSITKIRRRHVFRSGEGLWDTLWYSNFVSGCAMLVGADTARAALPFDPYMVYDHYIALYCADRGKIVSLPDRLLRHREHGDNQSSLLQGVEDKESYYRIRVEQKRLALEWLCEHFPGSPALMARLRRGRDWLRAREGYARGDWRCALTMWRERADSPLATALELVLPALPGKALGAVLRAAKKNIL